VQETYGEDPHLTGTMATQFVQGLQSGSHNFYKVGPLLMGSLDIWLWHVVDNNNAMVRTCRLGPPASILQPTA
jgi:hypothetical protein